MKTANRPNNVTAHAFFGARDPVLEQVLRKSLLEDRLPTIQIDDNAGRILQLLAMIHKPRRVIEIGSLFGYSTIHIARALDADTMITSFEIDPKAAASARRNVARAALEDRVQVLEGDAVTHMAGMALGSVDMIFIDAAKSDYPAYLKSAFPLLRTGGLLIADDINGDGDYSVEADDPEAVAERQGISTYARAVSRSPRFFSALIGTETGLLVSVKT